jgi:deazaflavin-dependent oxidoreductase (nitroreductase family)
MANRVLHQLKSLVFRVAIERFGVNVDRAWILEVPGRRTGVLHHNPVKLLDVDGERYLVALYGHTDWSRNLRAAGGVARLRHRSRTLSIAAKEIPVAERPRILRAYLAAATRGRTIDILGAGRPNPDDAHLRRIVSDHPVFRLTVTGEQSDVRGAAGWAVTSGVAGLISGGFLIAFFAVGRTTTGELTSWAWFGPANDLTSAVQAFSLVPVALALRDLMPDRPVQRWTRIGVAAMFAATVLPVLLVVGVLPFPVQAPMVTFCFGVLYCWLFAINRAGQRASVLPSRVARTGMLASAALGAAAITAAVALLLPRGSVLQYVAFAIAGAGAAVAWLAFPLWALLIARVLKRRDGSTQPLELYSAGSRGRELPHPETAGGS